jgi:hypothetical protein
MAINVRSLAEFHRSVGHALTRWQLVETGLYLVTHCLLGTDHQRSALVFFHIESARTKVSVTDKLCKLCLPPKTYQKHWRPIKTEIGKAVDIRNALAHFDVSFIDLDELRRTTKREPLTKHPIMLTPNSHDISALRDDGTFKGLYVETLQKTAEWFHRLALDLNQFVPAHIPDWQQQAASLPPETRHLLETIQSGKSP